MVLARYRFIIIYYRLAIFPVPAPRSVFSKIIRYRVPGLSALSASEREKTATAALPSGGGEGGRREWREAG